MGEGSKSFESKWIIGLVLDPHLAALRGRAKVNSPIALRRVDASTNGLMGDLDVTMLDRWREIGSDWQAWL